MYNEEAKRPRKKYAKPLIAVEDFTLNQFIANNCAVKTRDNDDWRGDLQKFNPFMYSYVMATGQYIDSLACSVHADTQVNIDGNMDTLCYHTSTSPLFTS